MATFHFDSSALVKGYVLEQGSSWVESVLDPANGHIICLPNIGIAEVVAAFARLQREGVVIEEERDDRISTFLYDCRTTFHTIRITGACINTAVRLIQKYPLRGYDAVQCGVALVTNKQLLWAGEQPLTIVSADEALLTAASAEGLATENPNDH